jgi:magnesium chelatase subunit I
VQVPRFVREVIEGIAFTARQDKRVDKRSGVSQRLPITCLENAASNAERRSILAGEREVVVRIGDVYRALPALTGKLELEYEGEMRGADLVAQELIHAAIGQAFDLYFADADLQKVVQWFELGGTLQIDEESGADRTWITLNQIQGLASQLSPLQIPSNASSGWKVAAAEFLLEGLCAHRRISRSEELGYHKDEKRPAGGENQNWREQQRSRSRRPLN